MSELFTALSQFQSELKPAGKTSSNPFFKSKYADLAAVWNSIREPLAKNGLSIIQTTRISETGPVLVTSLCHKSGQSVSGEYPIKAKDDSPQAIGSAVSYARRYALSAILGVVAEDDDGEAAMGRKQDKVYVSTISKPD